MLTVVGSVNIDLVVTCERIPNVGETVIGRSFCNYPGGKGANQAVAAARIGCPVSIVGCVGQDSFGIDMIEGLKASGVDVTNVERISGFPTGTALISVDSSGQNNIVVVPGANFSVTPSVIERHQKSIIASDAVLCQLEIPIESVVETFRIAKSAGRLTILNPAPARPLPDELIKLTDILVPNEHELSLLSDIPVRTNDDIRKAADKLFAKGVKQLLVTIGRRGCAWVRPENLDIFPIYDVPVVDTTAAGDSFIGGFVQSFLQDGLIDRAIRNGNAVASLSVQKEGAQSSLPDASDLASFKIRFHID